jgi:hypothetical protein
MRRVKRCLPYRLHGKNDYDYVVERSDGGHYHYHGFLALPQPYGDWLCDGPRRRQLDRDVVSFKRAGQYRRMRVHSHLIEPIRWDGSVDGFARYITKTYDFLPSSETYPQWTKPLTGNW